MSVSYELRRPDGTRFSALWTLSDARVRAEEYYRAQGKGPAHEYLTVFRITHKDGVTNSRDIGRYRPHYNGGLTLVTPDEYPAQHKRRNRVRALR